MASSLRYKFVKNTTGVVITDPTVFSSSDGDNKQEKLIRHVLATGDIGSAAGQVGEAAGLIVDTLPKGYNVLWIQGLCYRPAASAYTLLDNFTGTGPLLVTLAYKINTTDNTIRVINTSWGLGAGARLVAGDVVTIRLAMGKQENSADVL